MLHRKERTLVHNAESVLKLKATERMMLTTDEEASTCTVCKAFCRFSRIVCKVHPTLIYCLQHINKREWFALNCGCHKKHYEIQVTFPLDCLHRLQLQLSKQTHWSNVLGNYTRGRTPLNLDEYKTALRMATQKNDPISFELQNFVQECEQWVKESNEVISRNQSKNAGILKLKDRVEQLLQQSQWLPFETDCTAKLIAFYKGLQP